VWCDDDFDKLLPRQSTARWSDVGELLPQREEAKEAANVAKDFNIDTFVFRFDSYLY